jgi:hypothetical protein
LKVLLEKNIWLAPGKGDPARTCVEGMAKEFYTVKAAREALEEARKHRPYKNAVIQEGIF